MISSPCGDGNKKTILPITNLKLILAKHSFSNLLIIKLDDFYHLIKVAIGVSLLVYIKQNIEYDVKTNSSCKQLKVFEIRFGTGLNDLIAINWTKKIHPY